MFFVLEEENVDGMDYIVCAGDGDGAVRIRNCGGDADGAIRLVLALADAYDNN